MAIHTLDISTPTNSAQQNIAGGNFSTDSLLLGDPWFGRTNIGLRFTFAQAIAAGEVVSDARLDLLISTFNGAVPETNVLRYKIHGEARSNPPGFGIDDDVNSRALGNVDVDWNSQRVPSNPITVEVPGVAPVIQEIVDREGGIAAGESIVILLYSGNSSGLTDDDTWQSIGGAQLVVTTGTAPDPEPEPDSPPVVTVTLDKISGPAPLTVRVVDVQVVGEVNPTIGYMAQVSPTTAYQVDSLEGFEHTYTTPELHLIRFRAIGPAGPGPWQDIPIDATVTEPAPDPDPAPTTATWPKRADLAVGDIATLQTANGARLLRLDAFNVVSQRHKVQATVSVSSDGGSSWSPAHTIRVGGGGVPVSIDGMRIFGYAWRGGDLPSLEQVSVQGSWPLQSGKDVSFLLSDASAPMYAMPVPDSIWPFDWKFWNNSFFQGFGEPQGGDSTETHSGFDVGTVRTFKIRAWVRLRLVAFNTNFNDGAGRPDGGILLESEFGRQWIITHAGMDTLTNTTLGHWFEVGDEIASVSATNPTPHNHIGSDGHSDGGSVRFFAELWQEGRGATMPSPMEYEVHGAVAGNIGSNIIAGDESGDLPPTIGGNWRRVHNYVRSIARVGEHVASTPFGGVTDGTREPRNSVAYHRFIVNSGAAVTGQIKFGVTDAAVIWHNRQRIWSGSSGRFNSHSAWDELPLQEGQFSIPVALDAGRNEFIVKSAIGGRSGIAWLFDFVLEAPGIGPESFTTNAADLRVTDVSGGAVSLAWKEISDEFAYADRYIIEADQDPAFASPVRYDRGRATEATVNLPIGTNYVRVLPWDDGADEPITDRASVTTALVESTVPTTGVLPARTAPGNLAISDVPIKVAIGFDDNPRKGAMRLLREDVFTPDLVNKDGTRIVASWYLIGSNMYGPNQSDPLMRQLIVDLARDGHEIGNHGWWGLAQNGPRGSIENWRDWVHPTHDAIVRVLTEVGGYTVAEAEAMLTGYRAAEDLYDEFLHAALIEKGYAYSCSTHTNHPSNQPPYFPGILANDWPGNATWDTSRLGNYPGQWTIPQSYILANLNPLQSGGTCDTEFNIDTGGTTEQDVDDYFAALTRTIEHSAATNRFPVSICMHSQRWGPTGYYDREEWDNQSSPISDYARLAMRNWIEFVRDNFPVEFTTNEGIRQWMLRPTPYNSGGGSGEPQNMAPVAQATAPTTAIAGQPVTVQGSYTDEPTDSHTGTVDWGDSTVDPLPLNQQERTFSASHDYAQPGVYPVRVTITDAEGLDAVIDRQITVDDPVVNTPNLVEVEVKAAVPVFRKDPQFAGGALAVWNYAELAQKGPDEFPILIDVCRTLGILTGRMGGGLWVNRTGFTRDPNQDEPGSFGQDWKYFTDLDTGPLDSQGKPTNPSYNQTHAYRHVYRPDMADSMANWADEVGADVVVQVNIVDNNPVMWADMVRYINIEQRRGVVWWELGNEIDLIKPWGIPDDPNDPNDGHVARAKEYFRRCIRYVNLMRAVDPTIKFILPVTAHPSEGNAMSYTWMQTIASEMARTGFRVDALGLHYYGGFNTSGPRTPSDQGSDADIVMLYDRYADDSTIGPPGTRIPLPNDGRSYLYVTKRKFADMWPQRIREIFMAAIGEVPPMWVTEWRQVAQDGNEEVHSKMSQVAWHVDVGMRLMRNGIANLMYYDLHEAGLRVGTVSDFGIRNSFYWLLMLNHMQGTGILETTSTMDDEGFGAFATVDEDTGARFVTLVNPYDTPHTARVRLSGLPIDQTPLMTTWRFETQRGPNEICVAQDFSINGWQYDVGKSPEANLAELYDAGIRTPISQPYVDVFLEPYKPVRIAFSAEPIEPPPPPQPAATFHVNPTSGQAPHSVTFDTAVVRGVWESIEVDYGDGTTVDYTNPQTPQGDSHVYESASVEGQPFVVRVTVTGPGGAIVWTDEITVEGEASPPPTGEFSWSAPDPADPTRLLFEAVDLANVASLQWQFGDGMGSSESNPYHRYSVPLQTEYTVRLILTGPGGQVTVTHTVPVEAPDEVVAGFEVVPGPGPRSIQIVNHAINALEYRYDYGDGTQSADPLNAEPVHTYGGSGADAFIIRQTVTGEGGLTDTFDLPVLIVDPEKKSSAPWALILGAGVAIGSLHMAGRRRNAPIVSPPNTRQ